jgi:O-antigen/teichoic acid export membrane protein/SAM-dependent methyltransferase
VNLPQDRAFPQNRLGQGYLWVQGARMLELFLAYLVVVLVARRLGPEANGSFAVFLSAVQVLALLSSLGLDSAVLVTTPRNAIPGLIKGLLAIRLGTTLMASLLCLLVWKTLEPIIGTASVISEYVPLLILFVTGRGIVSLLTAYQTGKLHVRLAASVTILVRSVELAGVLWLTANGGELYGVLRFLGGTTIVQALLLLPVLRKVLREPSPGTGIVTSLRLGAGFWGNALLEFVLGRQADILLLGLFLVDTASIGRYDAAVGLGQLLNVAPTLGLAGLAAASFSALGVEGKESIRRLGHALTTLVLIVVTPVLVFALLFGRELLTLLFSAQYAGGAVILQITAAAFLITRLLGGGITADILHAQRMTRSLLLASAASGAANLLIAILLIPLLGSLGAALATGAAAVAVAAIHGAIVKRAVGKVPSFARGIAVVLAGGGAGFLAGMAVVPHSAFEVLLCAGLFFLMYAAGLYLVKPLTGGDLIGCEGIHPVLGRYARPFARPEERPGSVRLTDRQKWAFDWLPAGVDVLDLGASNTPLSAALQQKASRVVLVDVDQTAMADAAQSPHADLAIVASGSRLPLQDGSVGCVLMLDLLEHVGDEAAVLREVHRVLRPEGQMILSVPHRGLFHFLDPLNLSALIRGNRPGHKHYTRSEIERLLQPHFIPTRIHYGGLFLYPVTFGLENFFRRRLALNLKKFFSAVGDVDFDVSWGPLSYNLVLEARRRT